MGEAKAFEGYRALGFCSNHIPVALRYHRKHRETYVITCVGRAFHTYNTSRLGIISISDSHSSDIQCLAVDDFLVYTACSTDIYAYSHGKKIEHRYIGHKKPVQHILPFAKHLISVDSGGSLKVWQVETEELFLELEFDPTSFDVTCLLHPSTCINKILIGSRQGGLQLWNLKSAKRIHDFTGLERSEASSITLLKQAPAVDVVAVGQSDGSIIMHNIRMDRSIITVKQQHGAVTSITFRTDGPAVMLSGSVAGHITLWDLERGEVLNEMRDAHDAPVTSLECIASEPLLISAAADNALKMWVFDLPDGAGRLLRQRCGHSQPPTKLLFLDADRILSAADDCTVRVFSTRHERHDKSLGRASFNKADTKRQGLKRDTHCMPPVTHMAACTARESDWDGVAACHRGLSQVTTWSVRRGTMGEHRLQHQRFNDLKKHRSTHATCVELTGCGNFTLIGYSSGHVDMYNMQSGIYRGSLGEETAHKGAVRSVNVDALNQIILTTGSDASLRVWYFRRKKLMCEVKLAAAPDLATIHRDSCLLAIALSDFSLVVFDLDVKRIVRKYSGHYNRITDVTFSPNGRWLVSASTDATIKTWDIPSGALLDVLHVQSPASSVCFSPSAEFLATSHIDELGVYLWANATQYTGRPLRPILDERASSEIVALPTTARHRKQVEESVSSEEMEEDDYISPEQLSNELITLSHLPDSRWRYLLKLDVIKERNKPREVPKKPKAAPFFLPTIAGLEPKFAMEDETENIASSSALHKLTNEKSPFQTALTNSNYEKAISILKKLSPSSLDLELRDLDPDIGGSIELIEQFLTCISILLDSNVDFELANSWLGLCLKLHGDIMSANGMLLPTLQKLQSQVDERWDSLEQAFIDSVAVTGFIKGTHV